MRPCNVVLADVDAAIDGLLRGRERLRFALHLAICPRCDVYVRQLQVAREALRASARATAPGAEVRERLGNALAEPPDLS